MSQAQETLPDTVPGFAEMEEEEQLLMKRKQELEKLEREIAVCEAQVAEETTRCYRFEEAHDAYVTQVEKTKDLKRQLALLGEKVHRATEAACTSEGCSPETQELLNQEADNLIAEQDRLLYQLKASEKAERDKHAALQQARDEATDVLKAEKTAAATLPKEDLELLNQLDKQAQIRALRSDALENAKAANEAKQEEERAKKEEEQKRLDQERAKKKEEEEKMEAELEALRKAKEREDALRKAREEEQKKKEAERVAQELEVKKKAAEAEAQALRIAAEKKAQEDKKAAEAEALRMAAEKEEQKKKTEQAEALRKAQEEKKNMMEAKRLAHELARKKIEEELQKKAQELDALKKQQEEENQKLLDEEFSGEDAALQRELLKHANIQRDLRLQEEAAKARLEKEKEKAKFRADQEKMREEKSVFENKVSKLMESLSVSREDAEGLLKLQEMQKQNNGTSPGAFDGKESDQNAKRKIELEDIEARTAKAKLKLEMTREREAEMKLRSGARPLEESIEPPNMDGEGPPKMPRRLSP